MSQAGTAPRRLVALSTASVYPDRTPDAFEVAARLGYDGVEVMVTPDAVSQDVEALRRLADYHGVPVLAVHAPCLLITQRVWGREPWGKLVRAKDVAEQLGARVVVVHPPFRWQRDYARDFRAGLARMQDETDVVFAVENMFPLRARGTEVAPYAPSWNPVPMDYPHVTLDLSHTAVSGSNALEMADELGGGSPTCTWPTAPGYPTATSTWSPAGVPSPARRCCGGWPPTTTRGWSCWRSRRSGRQPRRHGRRTWPRPWSSPGPTWPPRGRRPRARPRPGRPRRARRPPRPRPAHRRPGSVSPPSG